MSKALHVTLVLHELVPRQALHWAANSIEPKTHRIQVKGHLDRSEEQIGNHNAIIGVCPWTNKFNKDVGAVIALGLFFPVNDGRMKGNKLDLNAFDWRKV